MRIPIIGQAANTRSRNAQADLRKNLYVERAENGVDALYIRPGLSLFKELPAGTIRGMIVAGGYLWVICGESLYKIDNFANSTFIGYVYGSNWCGMAENGIQIMIGANTLGYIVTIATSTLTAITDPDFVGADWVDFLDGFFIFGLTGSSTFYGTALYDGSNIDALDFATAEGAPDPIVTGIVDHRELLLFGQKTLEGWRNTGASGFPIERIEGAFMEHGCAAYRSVVKIDNSVFFLGSDDKGMGMIWRIDGYSPIRVSVHSVETQIKSYGDLSDAYAWAFQDNGHMFYVITFPNGNATWAYDVATQTWSEWNYRDPLTNDKSRHLGAYHVMFAGKHIVCHHTDSKLYEMSMEFYDDDGDYIEQLLQFKLPSNENKRLLLGEVELVTEPGTANLTGNGSNPQAMLSISVDSGHTWGNERTASLGLRGDYSYRTIWRRCGSGNQITCKIVILDPIKTAWIDLVVKVESGTT